MISKEICNAEHKSIIFILHYNYLQLGIAKTQADSQICAETNAVSLLCYGSTKKELAKKTIFCSQLFISSLRHLSHAQLFSE